MSKTCIITGAASGLGFEFAKLAAQDNYDLVLIDINLLKLEESKEILAQHYPVKIELIDADLSKPHIASEIYLLFESREPEILINNAGFGLFGQFAETSWETEQKMINLHILTTVELTKLFLQPMLRHKIGRIMNVASLAAFQPGPYASIYHATKAFVKSFSEALATEVKGSGVTVTVFCPGQTQTNFSKQVAVLSNSNESKVRMFTSPAGQIAAIGYKGMMKGKTRVIPGKINKTIAILSHLIPGTITSAINGKIQRRIRK